MFQRDYILRMIEQMGMVLARLRETILGRTAQEGEVHDGLQDVVGKAGFDLDLLLLADDATVELMVAPTGEVEPGQGWLAAESLYLFGLEAQLDDRPDEARQHFSKALRLYRLLEPDAILPSGFPEATERIEEITTRIAELET